MSFPSLLLLGFIAGATIIIGLAVGRLKSFNPTARSALTMLATGILVFLLVDILGSAMGQATSALPKNAPEGAALVALIVVGFLFGFVSLVMFENRWIKGQEAVAAERLSLMIALGIGLHNLSEGLAIGQSYLQGEIGLSVTLIVGFALHNATEGFGIVGPMVRQGVRPSWGNLLLLAAIGGGPTFVGTVLGSLWTSTYLSVFVLAVAGGALLYVIKELFAHVRKDANQVAIMASVVLGFALGWGTDLIASL